VFNQPAKIGGVTEIISRSALDGVDLSDAQLLTNHNAEGIPLARSPKTLTLEITEKGFANDRNFARHRSRACGLFGSQEGRFKSDEFRF
jgi:phage head maturation protease